MLREIVRVVEVNNPFVVCRNDIGRQQNTTGKVFGHFPCHIVALYAVHRRIFIRVFLFYFFVIALDKRHDLRVRRVGLSHKFTRVTIRNIFTRKRKRHRSHQAVFYHILNFFYVRRTP